MLSSLPLGSLRCNVVVVQGAEIAQAGLLSAGRA
jgi:hypothetical protein